MIGPPAALASWFAMMVTTCVAGLIVHARRHPGPGHESGEFAFMLMMALAAWFVATACGLYWPIIALLFRWRKGAPSRTTTAIVGGALALPAWLLIVAMHSVIWGGRLNPDAIVPGFTGLLAGGLTFGWVYAWFARLDAKKYLPPIHPPQHQPEHS